MGLWRTLTEFSCISKVVACCGMPSSYSLSKLAAGCTVSRWHNCYLFQCPLPKIIQWLNTGIKAQAPCPNWQQLWSCLWEFLRGYLSLLWQYYHSFPSPGPCLSPMGISSADPVLQVLSGDFPHLVSDWVCFLGNQAWNIPQQHLSRASATVLQFLQRCFWTSNISPVRPRGALMHADFFPSLHSSFQARSFRCSHLVSLLMTMYFHLPSSSSCASESRRSFFGWLEGWGRL